MDEFRDGTVIAIERSRKNKLVQIEDVHQEEAAGFPLSDEGHPESERYIHLLHS